MEFHRIIETEEDPEYLEAWYTESWLD